MSKNLCIIQARMGSTRLPGKVLKKLGEATVLEYLLKRVAQSKLIDKTVIATTNQAADDPIQVLCQKIGVDCFRGSESDVLDRHYQCALKYPEYDTIIRITGDCPLIDPRVIDRVVNFFQAGHYDYVNNNFVTEPDQETFPDGMDVEVFSRQALTVAAKKAKLYSEREHVTPYLRHNKKFKKGLVRAKDNFSNFRLTVDHQADLEVIQFIVANSPMDASYLDYVALLQKNPEIMEKNMDINRNEGYFKALKNDFFVKK